MDELIAKLDILHESDRAVLGLIAQGRKSVPGLRDFLLRGTPGTVFQPRMNAVRALAQIARTGERARDEVKHALIDYLNAPVRSADPAVRFGEEAVRNTAVEALSEWRDDLVADLVMDLIRAHPLAGACKAAGELRIVRAAPYLIDALSDDVARPRAMTALTQLLPDAAPLLIEAALRGKDADSSPMNQHRAQAAARILTSAALTPGEASALAPALESEDPETAVCIARVLAGHKSADRRLIAERVLNVLPRAPWFLRDEIRELLQTCGAGAIGPRRRIQEQS